MSDICLLFLTYSNIFHVNELEDFFENCNIYIHPKYIEKLDKKFKKYVISNLVKTQWGDKSIIYATLELLKAAYANPKNKWFILCSEDIYPLVDYYQLNSYLSDQEHSIFDVTNETKNKTSQFWALKREDVHKILDNEDKYEKILKPITKKYGAFDELFFLSLLKEIDSSYTFTNSKFCYVKWLDNVVSKHPTTFNCLLKLDVDEIESNNSCFIRKTYPTFKNVLCSKKKLNILLIFGSETIKNCTQFIIDFKDYANIFILSFLDNVDNEALTNICCQTYYCIWNNEENAINAIKEQVTGNLLITTEKFNLNNLKSALTSGELTDEDGNSYTINFDINSLSFDTTENEYTLSDTMNVDTMNIDKIELQLGDVIEIKNPINEQLNDRTFFIDYIDPTKISLIDTESLNTIRLNISPEGIIGDGNITYIAIISRNESRGYAEQNGLLPGIWINIYFGGDFPTIITGEITNLENDMIEIKSIDGDILYLNFDYQGLPEDLPIELIEIREEPLEKEQVQFDKEEFIPELELEKKVLGDEEIDTSMKNVKNQLREFIIKADQIQFGEEELGTIVQYVDVSSKHQRYSLETQLSDLLDELLSTVPSVQRTSRVLNNIHIMIERFKQLRNSFSTYDKYDNVVGPLIKESTYKPLLDYFNKFNKNLYWILPVVKNVKKIYDAEHIDEDNNDIENISLYSQMENMQELVENYKSNNLPAEQNKYSALYSELYPYFTPFSNVSEESMSDIIIEKEVNTNINTVIDNLTEMYSSIFNNNAVRSRRFIISKYNLANTKLDTVDSTSSVLITIRTNINNNDVMDIKSFITLPEPVIRFSRINLPGTNILDKTNLNLVFLNYWQLLKKKTNVNNIFVDNLETNFDFNEQNFVDNIKNYVLNLNYEDLKGLTKAEIYEKFVQLIVPKTKVVFNLMKKYIIGKLSIVNVVSYLEPFLIYSDDLTYMQYKEITQFIDEQISQYNKKYIERSRLFKSLSSLTSDQLIYSSAFSIIDIIDKTLKDEVFFEGYGFIEPEKIFANSELLRKLLLKDYSRLYTAAISLQSVPLMFPSEFSSLFEEEKKANEEELKKEKSEETCKTILIAKYYTSVESLELDNDKIIYFDKKYDKTNYGLLEENYQKELLTLSSDELRNYIIKDLMEKKKMVEKDAVYLATTLVDGHKAVLDGQYAILYKGYKELSSDEVEYYIRKDNKWIIDKDVNEESINTDESTILCDIQRQCINKVDNTNSDDKCESLQINELELQTKLLKDVVNEFDNKYKMSKEDFEKNMKQKFEYFMTVMVAINKIEIENMLKHNNQKYRLGSVLNDEVAPVISPYQQVLNLILGQSDIVKKQHDIIKFVNLYTREGDINLKTEDNHWLYCEKSSVKLIPCWKFNLATAYVVEGPDGYIEYLEKIKSQFGIMDEGGDWWCDKFSGWPICKIDFDIEEGYEASGFKASSRSIMESDAGSKIISVVTNSYSTPETKMINNIVNAISVAMGINIEIQKEFIMNVVIESIRNTVESEKEYKQKVREMAEKGKKIPSYNTFYNTALLYYTLGAFLISIQTAMPSIKTRKTHPGCIRSFSGYPFEGTGDFSSVTYLGCVAYDIRESGEPWNVLKGKKQEMIITKLKAVINDVLLLIPDVQRKFEEKTAYLLTISNDTIPEDHNITKWLQFLPPLVNFKIKHLVNISEEFKKSLISELRSGSINQREKLLVIDSKIIQFSLSLIERIQEVVKKQPLLLHSSNNEPYLENACCESKEGETTISYFFNKDSRIDEYNQIVTKLLNMMADIISYSKSGIFYSNINTKNKYPSINQEFSEKTIYLSFIHFCKFKSLIPIPEDLLPLCTDKPGFELIQQSDSVERIIQKLKDDGRNYKNDQFLRLLQIIGKKNIIHTNLKNHEVSSITKMVKILEVIDEENDEVVEKSLRKLIINAIDEFDLATTEYTKEITDLNNFLIRNISDMKEEIIDFVKKNSSSKISKKSIKKMVKVIENLSDWNSESSERNKHIKISNDSLYSIINFYKNFIDNFINIFPNIILNSVNYDDIHIPNYFKFSGTHINKLKKYVSEYYYKLKTFYGTNILSAILVKIQQSSKNLVIISNSTPAFTSIQVGEETVKPVFDERTSKFLFEYYLLRIFINYIELSDEENMVVTEVVKELEVSDVFSVEHFEELDTHVDLSISSKPTFETSLVSGNKKELKQNIAELFICFTDIMGNEKDTINTSYEEIQDRVFKLKEREKDLVTDRLKRMTDEERNADTILKINKLGMYSKGMQKGLTTLDKDFYDEEREFRDEMTRAERNIRRKNTDVNDDNIDMLIQDYFEQKAASKEIDDEAYDMSYMNELYYDGNTDCVGAPEEEYEDYENEY